MTVFINMAVLPSSRYPYRQSFLKEKRWQYFPEFTQSYSTTFNDFLVMLERDIRSSTQKISIISRS